MDLRDLHIELAASQARELRAASGASADWYPDDEDDEPTAGARVASRARGRQQ